MSGALSEIEFRRQNTDDLTAPQIAQIQDLFDKNYQQANLNYLDASLKTLGKIALAHDAGRLVGFSLADTRFVPIPGMKEEQVVLMGGIGCIDPNYRRLGLFSRLANLAGGDRESILNGAERLLACGRFAHPASIRNLRRLPGAIPNDAVPLSAWHVEVGATIAELFGVRLKPGTLIVQGNGTPVGYPNIDLEVSEEEWGVFEGVDRDRGDSLLGMGWAPTPPVGW